MAAAFAVPEQFLSPSSAAGVPAHRPKVCKTHPPAAALRSLQARTVCPRTRKFLQQPHLASFLEANTFTLCD